LLSARKREYLNAIELTGQTLVQIHVFHLLRSDLEDNEDAGPIQREQRSYRLKLTLRLRHDRYNEGKSLKSSDVLMEQPVEIQVIPHETIDKAKVRFRWPNMVQVRPNNPGWTYADMEGGAHIIPIPVGHARETWGPRARLRLTLTGWNENAEDSAPLQEIVIHPGQGEIIQNAAANVAETALEEAAELVEESVGADEPVPAGR
jgi:hypothetical protein